jgi:hypothetical protein
MKPRKSHLLGAVLFAVLALSAITASGASALESVWLVDGVKPTEALATVTEGLFFIEIQNELKQFVVLLHCGGLFNGTIATGGNAKLDEVTKIFNAEGTEIGELAGGKPGIDCTVVNTVALSCDNAAKLAELWPDNLPWPSVIVLVGGGFDDNDEGGKNPGFDLLCLDSMGFVHENLCEGPIFALLENTVENDVLAKFSVQELLKPCAAGNELGFVEGTWLMTVPGKTLSVGEG